MATDFDDVRETPGLKASDILFTAGARIQVDAPADHVFKIIKDFSRYSQWNRDTPTMTLESPEPLQKGSAVKMQTVMVDQDKTYDIPIEILRLDDTPDTKTDTDALTIAWRGMMMPAWFAVSERVQEIRPLSHDGDGDGDASRCEVVTWESMAGWGAYPFKYVMGIPTQLKAFNRRYLEDLKAQAEKTMTATASS